MVNTQEEKEVSKLVIFLGIVQNITNGWILYFRILRRRIWQGGQQMRLIDADKLKAIIIEGYREVFFGSVLWNILDDIPTAYDIGWIPVSERLPEEHDSMFKQFKNTDKWKPQIMFESISEEVIVTIKVSEKEKYVNVAHTTDGEWRNDFLRWNKEAEVIAWMPLPEHYRED